MRKNNYTFKPLAMLATSLMAVMALVSSCSDNGSGGGGDPEGNLQAVIDHLKKDKDLTRFADALKNASGNISESQITVIAVKNVAFEEDDQDATSSDIVRHVIKGSWPLDKLRETSQVETVGGTKLDVEYISDSEGQTLYINDMVIDMSPASAAGNIIYTTDVFLPATTALPLPQDQDYYKALGRKIEGRWVMTGYKIYSIYMPDHQTREVTERSSSEHAGCVEIFHWDPVNISNVSGYYGDYTLHHGCGNGTSIGAVAGNRRREEGVWKVNSTTEEGRIASLVFGFNMAGFRRSVSYGIVGPGVGSLMKYYVSYPGEELNPPSMYPSVKTEEEYTLRKLSNRP